MKNENITAHPVASLPVTSLRHPVRPDAFLTPDDQKIALISEHFREIMHILGLDLSDDSLQQTPHRVAKMYVKEIFSGLDPANEPEVTLFENKYRYNEMLVQKDITLFSVCEHHLSPSSGRYTWPTFPTVP